LQQLQLELHQPCALIQDVKGWQPPLLKKSWIAATFVEKELELAVTIVDKRAGGAAMDAYK